MATPQIDTQIANALIRKSLLSSKAFFMSNAHAVPVPPPSLEPLPVQIGKTRVCGYQLVHRAPLDVGTNDHATGTEFNDGPPILVLRAIVHGDPEEVVRYASRYPTYSSAATVSVFEVDLCEIEE